MKEMATSMGFEVVYGDTDSLFLFSKDCSSNIEEKISGRM
jgi:DNA polymerase elongation subunit (family B)